MLLTSFQEGLNTARYASFQCNMNDKNSKFIELVYRELALKFQVWETK